MDLENFIQLSGPLFEAVQSQSIFSDPKTFVDSFPKRHPQTILNTYLQTREDQGFDLKSFVLKHFAFPHEEVGPLPPHKSMRAYIESMWEVLLKKMEAPSPKSTLISLPKPHVVPGGRFQECFYWDSYFTALGLVLSRPIDLIKDMVENFAYLIDQFGYIPNGNRVYFTSRSQPPYFSFLLSLLVDKGEEALALYYFPELEKEYHFWMEGREQLSLDHLAQRHTVRIEEGMIFNRYWDEFNIPRPEAFKRETELGRKSTHPEFYRSVRAACASGWDFSSRWFEDQSHFETIWTLDLLPVDLNCLLYHLEITLTLFAKKRGEEEKAHLYQRAAIKRKRGIQTLFWNEKEQFFFDYHYPSKSTTKTWSLAGATPLFLHLATKAQAQKVAIHLEKKFLFEGGFVTSLKEGPHQWDMPNGWAPLEWVTIKGLVNYGYHALAREGAKRWLRLNEKHYQKSKKMLEKYNVRECSDRVARGEYSLQEGFGWTNGVALALIDLFDFDESL